MFETWHSAFKGKLNGSSMLRVLCFLLSERKNFLTGPRVITAAIVRIQVVKLVAPVSACRGQ